MAHQSLYRRFRPRRFADVRGQDHVVTALRNAVAHGSEGHAYLFSGPRGTGKTSTARILAKALNCPNLTDGEPCGECESCLAVEKGTSYDLFELDAASNNGVDAMRDLVSRTVVGSPGRTKVYILDEVHMLSPAASNALLKTLEEPPDHVCFVLATTDPQKVLATIRSRTQHFEFSLLSAAELTDYVHAVIAEAGLDVDEESVAHVVRQGRGSARDTLSALDLVVAAGGVSDRAESVEEILAAIVERDTGRVMTAVGDAVAQGREPRVLAEQLVGSLRDAFLASVKAPLDHLSDADQAQMAAIAASLGTPTITRALESLGSAIVDMRQAADPRVPLEVALIRLTNATADTSVAALVERIEALERRLAAGGVAPAAVAPAGGASTSEAAASPAPAAPTPRAEPAPGGDASGPAAVRAQLAARKGDGAPTGPGRTSAPPRPAAKGAPPRPGAAPPAPPTSPAASDAPPAPPVVEPPVEPPVESSPVADSGAPTPAPAPAAPGPAPSASGPVDLAALDSAMTDVVVPTLSGMARSLFANGRFTGEGDGSYTFDLGEVPARILERAEAVRSAVEASLSTHLGAPVALRITNGGSIPSAATAPSTPSGGSAAPSTASSTEPDPDTEEDLHVDVSELEDATDVSVSGLDRVVQAFPGAEVVEQEPS